MAIGKVEMMFVEKLEPLKFLIKTGPLQDTQNAETLSSDNEPQYKRPRVFAVRDFPPGCGRFARSFCMDMTAAERRAECARDFPPQCGLKAPLEAKAFNQVVKFPGVEVHDEEFENSESKANVSQASGGNLLPRNMESPRESSVGKSKFDADQRSELKAKKVISSLKCGPQPSWRKGKVAYRSKPGEAMRDKHIEKYKSDDDPLEHVERSKLELKTVNSSFKNSSPLQWKRKVAFKSKPSQGEGIKRLKIDQKPQLKMSEDVWKAKVGPKSFPSTARNTIGAGQASSSSSLPKNDTDVIRKKVLEILDRFKAICKQLEYEKLKGINPVRRVDLRAANILRKEGKYLNPGKILGHVPGIEVGDEFHYRIELNIVGLHFPTQGGIDYGTFPRDTLATSIVASGGYSDDLHNLNSLTYTGQGGNVMNPNLDPEDQKLEKGNLSLRNSMQAKTPVRMIRGFDLPDGKTKRYVYDGLYKVMKYWEEMGNHGKRVFKFQLDRIEDQNLPGKR